MRPNNDTHEPVRVLCCQQHAVAGVLSAGARRTRTVRWLTGNRHRFVENGFKLQSNHWHEGFLSCVWVCRFGNQISCDM